jgi:hypothetical protein
MNCLAASMALVAFFPTFALAQTEAAAPPVQAVAPPDANAPSERTIAAALDLLKATGAVNTIQAQLDALVPLETQQIKRTVPGISDEMVALVEKKLRDAVNVRQDELLRIQAIEYARHFNEQELHELADFYRSDLGRKYISSIPSLLQEVAPVVRQWVQSVVQQAQQDLLRSLPPPQNGKS